MAKPQTVTIPLDLEISKDSYNKLVAVKKTQDNSYLTGVALAAMCSQFLDAYANGGVLVRPDNIKKIEEACDAKVDNDVQIVHQIQKATNRDEGQFATVVKIDPALFPALKEHARTIGWSIEEVLDDIANRVVRDSLAFYVNSEAWQPVVYITEQQGVALSKLTGKRHFTGDDIIKLLETKQEQEVAA